MKKWFVINFDESNGWYGASQLAEFANRNNLQPGEIMVVSQKGYITTALYYAEHGLK